ncbi:hypothetical protein B484DRAFT_163039 [Ochromonadaceae sp. CCMP2298]|nr:hypothetical protein B484DRAFT_163039 [Ochromonadaceae sp. CCMP2298]
MKQASGKARSAGCLPRREDGSAQALLLALFDHIYSFEIHEGFGLRPCYLAVAEQFFVRDREVGIPALVDVGLYGCEDMILGTKVCHDHMHCHKGAGVYRRQEHSPPKFWAAWVEEVCHASVARVKVANSQISSPRRVENARDGCGCSTLWGELWNLLVCGPRVAISQIHR